MRLYLVIQTVSFCIILLFVVAYKWSLFQLHVNNVFVDEFLDEEVYTTKPPGFEDKDTSLVCQLHKTILLQSGFRDGKCGWF